MERLVTMTCQGGLYFQPQRTDQFKRWNGCESTTSGNLIQRRILGKLHVKTGDSGASSVGSAADELVLENSTDSGMTFLTGTSGYASINFADSGDANVGQILYSHGSNYLAIKTNDSERLRIDEAKRWV